MGREEAETQTPAPGTWSIWTPWGSSSCGTRLGDQKYLGEQSAEPQACLGSGTSQRRQMRGLLCSCDCQAGSTRPWARVPHLAASETPRVCENKAPQVWDEAPEVLVLTWGDLEVGQSFGSFLRAGMMMSCREPPSSARGRAGLMAFPVPAGASQL